MSICVPRRMTTWLRTHSNAPIRANSPRIISVSINRVMRLPDASTRSYTCNIYSAGASISKLMTAENRPMLKKARL